MVTPDPSAAHDVLLGNDEFDVVFFPIFVYLLNATARFVVLHTVVLDCWPSEGLLGC